MYDLKNHIYIDVIIQTERYPNETGTLIDMMRCSRIQEPVLWLQTVDMRAITSLPMHGRMDGNFWSRPKILAIVGFFPICSYQTIGAFDYTLYLILTKKQTKEIISQPHMYHCLTNKTSCDFLDPVDTPFYTLHFRVLVNLIPCFLPDFFHKW